MNIKYISEEDFIFVISSIGSYVVLKDDKKFFNQVKKAITEEDENTFIEILKKIKTKKAKNIIME